MREVFVFARDHGGNYGYRASSRPSDDARGLYLPNRREERQRGGKNGEFHGRRAVAVHHFTVQPQDQALESLQRRKSAVSLGRCAVMRYEGKHALLFTNSNYSDHTLCLADNTLKLGAAI